MPMLHFMPWVRETRNLALLPPAANPETPVSPPAPAPAPAPTVKLYNTSIPVAQQDLGLWQGDIVTMLPTITKPTIRWTGAPIPKHLFNQMVGFYRHALTTWNSEAMVRLAYNPASRDWALMCYPQTVRPGLEVKEIDNLDAAQTALRNSAMAPIQNGFMENGSSHSHCRASAFQSGTDSAGELKNTGVHITLGHVDQDRIDVHGRVVFRGIQYEIDWKQWFADWPEGLESRVDKFTLIPGNDTSFPDAWLACCFEPPKQTWSFSGGFSRDDDTEWGFGYPSYGGYHSSQNNWQPAGHTGKTYSPGTPSKPKHSKRNRGGRKTYKIGKDGLVEVDRHGSLAAPPETGSTAKQDDVARSICEQNLRRMGFSGYLTTAAELSTFGEALWTLWYKDNYGGDVRDIYDAVFQDQVTVEMANTMLDEILEESEYRMFNPGRVLSAFADAITEIEGLAGTLAALPLSDTGLAKVLALAYGRCKKDVSFEDVLEGIAQGEAVETADPNIPYTVD